MGALLLAAGMEGHYTELARGYNGLGMSGGTDRLPEDAPGKERIWFGRCVFPRSI
jgi:hypothetical protein